MKRFVLAAFATSLSAVVAMVLAGTSHGSGSAYANAVTADSPIAYWRAGDAPGTPTATDSSGHTAILTYGTSTSLGVPGGIFGDADTAMSGAGTLATASPAVSGTTVELWVRIAETPTGNASIFSYMPDGVNVTRDILIRPDGFAQADTRSGSTAYAAVSSVTIDDGDWHYIVVDYTNHLVYVDAVAGAPATASSWSAAPCGYPVCPPSNLSIGGTGFSGDVDEIAMYSSALTGNQIVSHASAADVYPAYESTNQLDSNSSEMVPTVPASAVPMSPTGPAPSGSYTTSTWSSEDTEVPNGLVVVNSTASGTYALTGGVVDGTTGAVIPNATVTLTTCTGCSPQVSLSTTTSSTGAFAFINVPPPNTSAPQTLTITATGYGTYQLTNLNTYADETFAETALLSTTAQTWDDPLPTPTGTQDATSDTGVRIDAGWYVSRSYIPPYIRVTVFSLDSNCHAVGSSHGTFWYRTRFYAIHTIYREIGANAFPSVPNGPFHTAAGTANGLWITNYAWFHMINGGYYDNTPSFECFDPAATIPSSKQSQYHDWTSTAFQKRMTRAHNAAHLTLTQFQGAFSPRCNASFATCYNAATCHPSLPNSPYFGFQDSYFDNHEPNVASQMGSKRADEACSISWDHIALHYFAFSAPDYPESTGAIHSVPVPRAAASNDMIVTKLGGGVLKFQFSDRDHGHQIGWVYAIFRSTDPSSGGVSICCDVPSSSPSSSEPVWSYLTYTPPAAPDGTHCWYYRLRAWNPSGWGHFADFSYSGSTRICP